MNFSVNLGFEKTFVRAIRVRFGHELSQYVRCSVIHQAIYIQLTASVGCIT
jgi:hypothetical protein